MSGSRFPAPHIRTTTRRPGALSRGVGLLAGMTALAAGGIAAGFELERRIVSQRLWKPQRNDEGFFSVRGRVSHVVADDGVALYAETDERDEYPCPPGFAPDDTITVVLVHGFSLSMDCFHFQRKHLRGRFRIVAYDQRSHGRSVRSEPSHCRVPQLGRDLERVLTDLVPEGPVVLIGHSMGGMTIMNLARTRPELFGTRILGVALLSTSPGDMADHSPIRAIPGRTFGRVAEPLLAALNRIPDLVDRGRRAGSDIGFVATKQFAFGSDVPASYVEFVSDMLGETSLEVIGDFYPAFSEMDETGAFETLAKVETAVIGGRNDAITPVRHTEAIIDLLPGAESLILDHCGHMGMLEHHDDFNTVIDNLLERVQRNLKNV